MDEVWAPTFACLPPRNPLLLIPGSHPWRRPYLSNSHLLFVKEERNDWMKDRREAVCVCVGVCVCACACMCVCVCVCVWVLCNNSTLISAPMSLTQSGRHAQEHMQRTVKKCLWLQQGWLVSCSPSWVYVRPTVYLLAGEQRLYNRPVVTCHPTIL